MDAGGSAKPRFLFFQFQCMYRGRWWIGKIRVFDSYVSKSGYRRRTSGLECIHGVAMKYRCLDPFWTLVTFWTLANITLMYCSADFDFAGKRALFLVAIVTISTSFPIHLESVSSLISSWLSDIFLYPFSACAPSCRIEFGSSRCFAFRYQK